ncbi:major facilitator superfamily domain-containing protein [Thelonectria olida]|uniref:Major facilitator superfamily domain-containing protein n=1 Tax=Thelonectria olida TaxID=1576542 RepID=A0A9P8VUK8_9HYPO|nr:major facilitator superfamily domain-containing protein [Thelonectria olida]
MIMGNIQLLPSWQEEFNHPSAPVLGLLNSIHTVGAMISLPLIGWFIDRFGPRKSTALGASWTLVEAILHASSKHVAQFVIALVGAPLLLVELPLPKHRGTVLTYFPTAWYIGAIMAAWTTYGTHQIAELEYTQIKDAILKDSRAKEQGRYLDLIKTKPNKTRLIIVTFCGLFLEICTDIYLCCIGITETITQTTISGCPSMYNPVLAMGTSLVVELLGRRKPFIPSASGMFIAFILWTTLAAFYTTYQTNDYAIGVLVSIFLSNGAYDLGWTARWAYPAELLPYEVRARGVTYMMGVMHAAGFFSAYVNRIGYKPLDGSSTLLILPTHFLK